MAETSPDFVVIGMETFRLLQYKENIIAQMQSNVAEVTPEQATRAAALRSALLNLSVLSEEVRDLQSDIWKAGAVRSSNSRGKRSSSMLGRSLLLDKVETPCFPRFFFFSFVSDMVFVCKGQRITDKVHISGPSSGSASSEVSPRRAKPLFDMKKKHSSDEASSSSPAMPRR